MQIYQFVPQVQSPLPISNTKKGQLGICGGFIADGIAWPPRGVVDYVQGVRSAGTDANVHLGPLGTPYGVAGRWFQDGVRTLGWSTGAPNSQSFTFVARVRANLAPTAPGVICRCGTSATSFSGNTIPLWRATTSFDMRVNGTDYTAAGTWNLEQWYDIAILGSAAACQLWVGTPEGEATIVINGAAATSGTIDSFFGIGAVGGGDMAANGLDIMHMLWANRPWSAGQLLEFNENPWAALFDPDVDPIYFSSSANVTVSITGISSTFSAGTVVPNTTIAITGEAATFASGTVTPTQDGIVGITGISATFSAGTVSVDHSNALTGQSATFSAGTVSPSLSVSLTGISATFSAGTVVPNLTVALTGNTGTFTAGTVTPVVANVTVAITGITATFSAGTVTPSGGSVVTTDAVVYVQASSATNLLLRTISATSLTMSATDATNLDTYNNG